MNFEIRQITKQIIKPEPLLADIKKRIDNNKNAVFVFNGDTGSGKSYATLKLAQDVSKMFNTEFTIKDNLAFNFIDLLKKIDSKKDIPGTVYIMEEVGSFGSGGSSREWQSEDNNSFFSYMQTSRCLNQIIILNCPSFGYLEKGSRQLIHYQLEALGINVNKKESYFKAFKIQCNRRTSKLYFKYLRYRQNGNSCIHKRQTFSLPNENLIKDYEYEKDLFVKNLKSRILLRAKIKEQKEKKQLEAANSTGCKHKYLYAKTKQTFRCRYCGDEIKENPYLSPPSRDTALT